MGFKEEIAGLVRKETGLADVQLESPRSAEMGDYAFPCFALARQQGKSPAEIAKELASRIKPGNSIERVEASGPYLNFFLSKKKLAEDVIGEILAEKENYGRGARKELVLVEFSQANTHKAFHVGHIRGTSFGESLARILEFQGSKVIRANYQGDTGMHIAKWIWNYSTNHSSEEIRADEPWIAGIYVDAVKRLEANPELQSKVDEINRKLESHEDKKLDGLWKKTRKISLDSLEVIYRELNTRFDRYYFESEVEGRGRQIAKELVAKGIAEVSDGAAIINLEKFGLGVWVLLRKDGTVLYSGKDLALAEKKFKDYRLDRAVYVVADQQNLHMQQLFKTLELMNFREAAKCMHIPYGLVMLPTGKMSSRTGDNILYSDFRKEVTAMAKQEIRERFPEIAEEELEKRALAITIAAIKYSMLKQGPERVIVFDPKESISFEGETGPYCQYTHARICSILRKHGKKPGKADAGLLKEEAELAVLRLLDRFRETAGEAAAQHRPQIIAHYLSELSRAFNSFYHELQVLKAEPKLRDARIAMITAVKQIISSCLSLLGIEAPERM